MKREKLSPLAKAVTIVMTLRCNDRESKIDCCDVMQYLNFNQKTVFLAVFVSTSWRSFLIINYREVRFDFEKREKYVR